MSTATQLLFMLSNVELSIYKSRHANTFHFLLSHLKKYTWESNLMIVEAYEELVEDRNKCKEWFNKYKVVILISETKNTEDHR